MTKLGKVVLAGVISAFVIIFAIIFIKPSVSNYSSEKFTITFDSKGGSEVDSIEVKKGRTISNITDLTPFKESDVAKNDEETDTVFTGWFKDQFAIANRWSNSKDIVISDVTLYAGWIDLGLEPVSISMEQAPLSNAIQWKQNKALDIDLVEVMVDTDEDGTVDQVVDGNFNIEDDNVTVTFTPTTEIQHGSRAVTIKTQVVGKELQEKAWVAQFKGSGSETNPFQIMDTIDVEYINNPEFKTKPVEGYFELANNISGVKGFEGVSTFAGQLDGKGNTITLETGASGLIYRNEGTIMNLGITGVISTGTKASIGTFASYNAGVIKDSATIAEIQLENMSGEVNNIDSASLGGAGGIVGTNLSEGVIERVDNFARLRGSIAIGGIAGINYGMIKDASSFGRIGAGNTTGVGTTMDNYSYMGGIVGINYGTLTNVATSGFDESVEYRQTSFDANSHGSRGGNVFAQAGGTNNYIGGIVGYNAKDAIIQGSLVNAEFIFGQDYIGGVAGYNDGDIIDTFINNGKGLVQDPTTGGAAGIHGDLVGGGNLPKQTQRVFVMGRWGGY